MLFFTFLMTSLWVGSITDRFYMDEPCESDSDCLFICKRTYTNCNMGVCGCKNGELLGEDLCYKPSVLGEPCLYSTHCDTDYANTECNENTGLCDCTKDPLKRKMKKITPKICVRDDEVGPLDQCTNGQSYYFINEEGMRDRSTPTSTTAGLCGCPERYRQDGIKCLKNKIGDPCNTTNKCFDDTGLSSRVVCDDASRACRCSNNTHQPSPPDNTDCEPIDVEKIQKFGSLEVGETCHKNGASTNMLCREGLTCDACPGGLSNVFTCNTLSASSGDGTSTNMPCREGLTCDACPGKLSNAFTCTTPSASSVLIQAHVSVDLLILTSSLTMMWM